MDDRQRIEFLHALRGLMLQHGVHSMTVVGDEYEDCSCYDANDLGLCQFREITLGGTDDEMAPYKRW